MILKKSGLKRKKSPTKAGVHQPWSVQVELTEGCNRLCSFCGLNGIRKKVRENLLYQSWEVAKDAAEGVAELCPTARVEFAMHGEPTLHPAFHEIIQYWRGQLPKAQFQLTTNGRNWMRDLEGSAMRAFEAGIDIIVLDTYEPERGQLQEMARQCTRFDVWDFYKDCIPAKFSVYANHHRKVTGLMVVMDDIGERSGESASRTLMNHAGNAMGFFGPLDKPLDKTCTNPFREVSICYDGDVNICCMDWGHEYVFGNVTDAKLRDIWFGARAMAARRVLQQRNRGFSPCERCNKNSGTRAGLLPKLGPPTAEDVATIRDTLAGGPARNGLPRKLLPSLLKYEGKSDAT